jgi:hypothetical protein
MPLELVVMAVAGADHGGALGPKDPAGDFALVAEVVGEVAGGHAVTAELSLEGAGRAQIGLELGSQVRRRILGMSGCLQSTSQP